ncbi:MAG: DUF1566 domain-containing protein [Desulfatibacillum sp.]|nr:DUF1566 domain-containing protein [Desulfatibacillum sp.]
MDRENYYILLELDIDPPEKDPARIDAAIKRMQANWSRLRNHPTKGIQAKNYIGLIPEIRKVMSDPELRDAEAIAAIQKTREKQGEIFAEIDRHLTLHLSKGYISNQEIAKLAELHHIDEEDIRARIKLMEEEKLVELDSQLGLRMAKGYMTQEEVSKLAKAHGMTDKDLKKRINVPIRKVGSTEKTKGKSLDKSLEKVINDNLRIVGFSSLYEFLGVPETTSIELLQKTARKKESQVLKIAKKDAMVTASGILAGQCSAVFRDQESRASYDISRGRSRLKDLEADIDVAGIDGKIRSQYFEILVKTAQDLGMDQDEAKSFIKNYCGKQKYTIEGMERKKLSKNQIIAVAASLLLLCLLVGGGLVALNAMQAKGAFQDVASRALAQPDLEKRLVIYRDYLSYQDPNKYTEQVNELIAQTQDLIARNKEKAALDALDKQVGELLASNQFGAVLALWNQHLKDYPKGSQTAQVKSKIKETEEAYDTFQFKALETLHSADTDVRIAAYVNYLASHPKGKHKEEVTKLIWNLGEEYFVFLQRRIDLAARQENWGQAIQYCEAYTRVFDNNRAKQLSREKETFQKRLKDQSSYEDLVARATRHGTDYDAAMQEYNEYLSLYPQTTARDKILEQIKGLQVLKYQARINRAETDMRSRLSTSKRFMEKSPGIVLDRKTGLTWTLLHSQVTLGDCMDYDFAKDYVENLSIEGAQGWRLPSAKELDDFYKTDAGYPVDSGLVFWTNKSFPRYADGAMSERVVVVPGESGAQEFQMDSRKCAAVHAVKK